MLSPDRNEPSNERYAREQEPALPSLLRAKVLSRWPQLVLCTAVGLLAGLVLDSSVQPLYRTQTTLTAERDLTPERDAVQTQAFIDRASAAMLAIHQDFPRRDPLSRLTRRVHPASAPDRTYPEVLSDTTRRTRTSLNPPLLTLTCDSQDPNLAATWCNALAHALLSRDQARTQTESPAPPASPLIKASILLKQQIATLEQKSQSLPLPVQTPDLSAQLKTLQQAILDTQAEARVLSRSGDQSDEYAATIHREQLLRLSFEGKIQSYTQPQRTAAQTALLQQEIASAKLALQTLTQQIAEQAAQQAAQPTPVPATLRMTHAASVPASPHSPHILVEAVLGAVLGTFLGLVLVLSLRSPKTPDRQGSTLPLPLLLHQHGVIPDLTDYVTEGPYDPFQVLAYSILLEDWGKGIRRYAITSLHAGSGKTTVAANIAIALSKTGLRVLLIDANLQEPALQTHFDLTNDFGLRNLLRDQADLEVDPIGAMTQSTPYPGLFVLTSGRAAGAPSALLQSPLLSQIFVRLARDFDLLLIDLPAVDSSETVLVAAQCDATLFVLPSNADLAQSQAAMATLSTRNIHIAGTAINHLPIAS